MSFKPWLQYILRTTGVLQSVDQLRLWRRQLTHTASNRRFTQEYPDFAVPPAHLAFDAYNTIDYDAYRRYGLQAATYIYSLIQQYGSHPTGDILEWGCGPARVIRHIPHLMAPGEGRVLGTDYNYETIRWCNDAIHTVHFLPNTLTPPLPFQTDHFRAVYAISVFTHLSEDVSNDWADELYRILQPGGVLIATLHGDTFQSMLLPHEKQAYQSAGVVIRGSIEEGKKMFVSYHSPAYVRTRLFRQFEVLHHELGQPSTLGSTQDVWVLMKR
ncbi:MAG TPA: class I SAM-dependent methyltransferase [Herpetosiphonaceae bacterium]